jgi:hypothetical protein
VRRSVAVAPLYVRTRRKRKDGHFLGGLLLTLMYRPAVRRKRISSIRALCINVSGP